MDKISLKGFAKFIRQEIPEYEFIAEAIDMENNKNGIGLKTSDDPLSQDYWSTERYESIPGIPKLWEYEIGRDGNWHALTPGGPANLGGHDVVEHEDGTITVSPSILVNKGTPREWHGFLKKGIWREC